MSAQPFSRQKRRVERLHGAGADVDAGARMDFISGRAQNVGTLTPWQKERNARKSQKQLDWERRRAEHNARNRQAALDSRNAKLTAKVSERRRAERKVARLASKKDSAHRPMTAQEWDRARRRKNSTTPT